MGIITNVVLVRHGEKRKNSAGLELLTPLGMRQVRVTTQNLRHLYPQQIFYSGELRTFQCATIAQEELRFKGTLEINKGIHYGEISDALSATDESCIEELGTAIAAGNTIKTALEISEYARLMRAQLTKAVIEMAAGGNSFGFSHSPLASLASPCLDFPYNICTGDAIIYQVHDGLIESADYFKCSF